jgi:hypothetical protein
MRSYVADSLRVNHEARALTVPFLDGSARRNEL